MNSSEKHLITPEDHITAHFLTFSSRSLSVLFSLFVTGITVIFDILFRSFTFQKRGLIFTVDVVQYVCSTLKKKCYPTERI